jgi:amphi-Trp domain-containing protein
MQKKKKRDVEKQISIPIFAEKLRRLADALERGGRFRVQVAGERICVPTRAECSIEYEREGTSRELEFQIKWTVR